MPLQGHLLCAIPFPEPKEVIERIQRSHPQLKITYQQVKPNAGQDTIPPETYQDVTILTTLFNLPEPSQIPNVQLMHLVSAGNDHIENLPIYKDTSFPITTVSGIHGPIISEWVIMTTLVASHHYPMMREWHKNHDWHGTSHGGGKPQLSRITDRVGQRLGILGYGSIARQVARVFQTMGMEIVVYTAHERATPEQRRDHGYIVPGIQSDADGTVPSAWFHGTDRESLHKFLAYDLDQILVSVPLTSKTRGMLEKAEFDILARRNAFVTNLARGEVVVQSDLVKALRDYDGNNPQPGKGLRGAALDVTSPEPLPQDDPLWDAPNLVLTPHVSGMNAKYATRALTVLEENLKRLERGEKLLNEVDREKGYASKTG